MDAPLPNGSDGRAPDGKFAPGWRGGPGNPFGKHWTRLRKLVIDLGKDCPPGLGEDSRERLMAGEVWTMALGRTNIIGEDGQPIKNADGTPKTVRIGTKDQLSAIQTVVAIYGGKKALQGDDEDEKDQPLDPDALAQEAAENLRALGLEAMLPPGLKRTT